MLKITGQEASPGYYSPALNQLMRQSGDSHALTHDGVRHHRGGSMTHGDAGQRRHGHRCHRHRHRHWCH